MSDSNDNTRVLITKDDRLNSNWVQGTINGGYKFEAKMFDNGSEFGINKGRVSKLGISQNGKTLVNYDRGWDVKPQTPEVKAVCESVLAKLNALGKEADIGKQKDLLGKIADNKQKVNHNRVFDVTITETLRMTVEIEAASREEAEQIASDNWRSSDYILDADNFVGVDFEAAPAKREKSRGDELC
jgi:hypothetical protein